jgi:hypothetical protein
MKLRDRHLAKNIKIKSSKAEVMTVNEWEDICNRCGLCCFEKYIDEHDRLIITTIPCRFLDIFSRECKVYHKRFKVGEDCQKLTPELVATVDWLPDECAYKKWQLEHDNIVKIIDSQLPPK